MSSLKLDFSTSSSTALPLNPRPKTVASSMWNPNQAHLDEDEDSWEITAFAKDTGSIMGTTWPPRFYSCTFCRREFRSAQALGGHMNVHRRDRIRFHHQPQPNSIQPIPATKVVYDNGEVCFFYQLPNDNIDFLNSIVTSSACLQSPSATTLYPSSIPTAVDASLPSLKSLRGTSSSPSHCRHMSSKGDDQSLISIDDGDEKVDLELRLGHRPWWSLKIKGREREREIVPMK